MLHLPELAVPCVSSGHSAIVVGTVFLGFGYPSLCPALWGHFTVVHLCEPPIDT